MLKKILKTLYDPNKARILYDLFVSASSTLIVISISIIFSLKLKSPFLIILLPITYTAVNYFYGIYSTYRLAAVYKKILIISYAGITTLALSYLFNMDALVSLLSTIFTIILCSLARILTNLPHQSIKSNYLNIAISSNQPILVVGGGGYIGSHVVKQLLEENEKVRIFDKFIYKDVQIKDIKSNNMLEIVNGDISDLYSLTLALKDTKAVIHLAGIVGDPAASLDEKLTRHINIVTTRMLKETVKAFRIPRFIFASSCSVYGATDKTVDETSRLNPVSLYAQTKIDSENDLLDDPADDFHPTILRFATVFGHSPRMRFDLVLNLFCAQAYYDGKITVFGGDQYRPFIHVSDIARSIIITLNTPQEAVSRQVFNVGDNSLNTTILDLAHLVSDIIKKDKNGKRVELIINKSLSDKRNYYVSFNKISSKLGFYAQTSFEEGIKEIYHHMRTNLYKYKYTDKNYSNFETTKIMKKEFHSKKFQDTHYSVLSTTK